jgi:hypothetical protein
MFDNHIFFSILLMAAQYKKYSTATGTIICYGKIVDLLYIFQDKFSWAFYFTKKGMICQF